MRNLPHGFDIYLVSVKTMKKIAQFFLPFSEKLNFMPILIVTHNGVLENHRDPILQIVTTGLHE